MPKNADRPRRDNHSRHLTRQTRRVLNQRCQSPARWRSRMAIAAGVLLISSGGAVRAEGFDLGLGLGFADHRQGLEGGWDVQLGGEFQQTEDFNLGVQWHHLNGISSVDAQRGQDGMEFDSHAFFLTMRPRSLDWLQLKAGVVSADYKIVEIRDFRRPDISQRQGATGFATGLGLVFGSEHFRVHLLDYEHYKIGREKFTVWSFSALILTGSGR